MTVLEHGAFALCGLLVYVLVTRIGQHRRQPSAAVAWVLVIAMFPYRRPAAVPAVRHPQVRPAGRAGSPAGPAAERRQPSQVAGRDGARGRRRSLAAPPWATSLLASFALPPPTGQRCDRLPRGRRPVTGRRCLQLLRGARHSLDLCTFVLGRDEIGDAFIDELPLAAKRGVRVRLLLDAIGSLRTSRSRLARAARGRGGGALVHAPAAQPAARSHQPAQSSQADHRRWRDRSGAAVATRPPSTSSDRPGDPAWEDLSFTARGPLAAQAQALFEHDWQVASGRVPQLPLPLAIDVAVRADRGRRRPGAVDPERPRPCRRHRLLAVAVRAPTTPRPRILAVSPYFVPDDALAVGVVPCLPARRRGDAAGAGALEPSAWPTSRASAHCGNFSRPAATVLLYPTMMHAKAVVVDDQLALCGTVNLDARSLFLNFELMFAFYGRVEIDWLAGWIEARSRAVAASRRRLARLVARSPGRDRQGGGLPVVTPPPARSEAVISPRRDIRLA